MRRLGIRCAAGALLLAGIAAPGVSPAPAQIPQTALVVDITRTGWIDLVLIARQGSRAEFSERVGSRVVPVGSATVGPRGVVLPRASRWRCDRLLRRFAARVVAPDGGISTAAFSIRTPSCRDRLAVSVPRRARRGQTVRVRVRDRWGIGGVHAQVCATRLGAPARCRGIVLQRDRTRAAPSFEPDRVGRWRVQVRLAGFAARRTVQVGVPSAPPRGGTRRPLVLATGDSTMQGLDSFLAEDLVRVARVRSQIRVATGISKPISPSWVEFARRQSRRVRPRVTVVSLGAVDNFSMLTPAHRQVDCCGLPWTAEYARRVKSMMLSYTRRARGRVAWLALPAPRDRRLAVMTAAINLATRYAAATVPGAFRVRLDSVFSPGGRYRSTLRLNGRTVRVRSPDGIHLTVAGTEVAAHAVVRALRRERALPGLSSR
jgi:hypothetical protein